MKGGGDYHFRGPWRDPYRGNNTEAVAGRLNTLQIEYHAHYLDPEFSD